MANTVKVGITAEDQGFKSTLDSMKSSASSFGQSLDTSGKKMQTLNGAFRSAQREAQNLAYAYSQLSAEARASDFGQQMKAQMDIALQAAGQLKDIKSDVAAEIKNISSDTAMWDATAQGIGVVSSSLQGLASAYGLLGGDVQAFTQALVVVNGVQSVANTIIGIGNALQKQSALMVGLRAAKTALFGTTEAAATVAETANTAATGANTAATGANTAAKGANAAANTGQVAALGAATTAQLANNAAVLANPYVACAVAIAALTAVIVAWCMSNNDATDSEIALGAAVDAFSEQVDSEMKKVGEQINLYDDLKRQYDATGGKVDEFSKKLINNTDVQKKLGVTVKSVDDVHRLFANNSNAYRAACMARASAMAAEAAQAALLGATLAELSKIQAKLMAGQEVNWRDMRKVVESMGYSSSMADQLMKDAGYVYESEGAAYGNIKEGTGNLQKLLTSITQGGAYKELQNMADAFKAEFDTINEVDFKGILTSNLNAIDGVDKATGKTGKAGKNAASNAKKAGEEIKKVLTSLEGCDAIIQDAEKQMKKLDSTSADYAKEMERLKNVILTARIAKLNLLDNTTIDGLTQSKKLIEQIIQSLPTGHPQIETLKNDLKDVNEKLYEMYAAASQSGDLKSLNNARSQIDNIIKELPEGSDELAKWARAWKNINDKILDAEQKIKDLKDDIQKGSKTWLDREIKKLQTEIDKLDPNAEGNMNIRATLELQKQDLQFQLNKLEQDSTVTVVGELKLNELDRSYKMTAFEQLSHQFDKLKAKREELNNSLEKSTSAEEYNKIRNSISEIDAELTQLQKNINFKELTDDVKNYNAELQNISYDNLKGMTDVFKNIYSVFTDLPDKLDECKDGFEGFFTILDAGFSLFDSIMSFIDGIKQMIDIIQTLTGAKEALNVVEGVSAATKGAEAAATQSQVIAEGEKTAADAANVTSSTAKTTALKAESTALLEAAASQIFAAHASIPFAGPSIAAGLVAEMIAAMAAAKGAILAMAAFAEGGIVGGNTTIGDQVIARLNAGEMVLNTTQQSRLFNMIDHGQIYDSGVNEPSVSTVRISGEDIVIALRNYGKINGNSSLTKALG